MLLTVDVGNTNVVIGWHDSTTNGSPAQVWRLSTDRRRTADEWRVLFAQLLLEAGTALTDVRGVVVASVVPPVTEALRAAMPVEVLMVNSDTDTGLAIAIDNPRELGADRIANAVAAMHDFGGPAIVVDMGTATTLDVISAEGAYLGGVIMPGLEIGYEALFSRTAALRRIEFKPPPRVIGTNTIAALQSGATFGYAAQVDGLCELIEKELGPCTIAATGGLSAVIAPLSHRIQRHEPSLTLRGLQLIYMRATTT